MFIPATVEETEERGWKTLDVILVSGDAYLDSPGSGIAVIGHVLMDAGYRVAIIPQPRMDGNDIIRFGEPRLFWGISSGCVDSMVANYNADRSRRRVDDFTPGGAPGRRPDRALIAYTGLIRRFFKNTAPIVLGGIEASLRRVAHYDYWQNAIRRSLIFDAKADILVFGMGEGTALDLARALDEGTPWRELRGLCYISKEKPEGGDELPSFEETRESSEAFEEMYRAFYHGSVSSGGSRLVQKTGDRYLVINPPAKMPGVDDLDYIHNLPYERRVHPLHKGEGKVRALDTVQFSITTHRGCCGECNFCSIAVHQGRWIVSRSEASILSEAVAMTVHPDFRGIISDVGGPTANMYQATCPQMAEGKTCSGKRCLFPGICHSFDPGHEAQVRLLKKIRAVKGVKRAFVASGIRYDLVVHDGDRGMAYLDEVISYHVSGQLRVAPEHVAENVLELMGKPGGESLRRFIKAWEILNKKRGKSQYLSYYYMAAHPGCGEREMAALCRSTGGRLNHLEGSVQIFTPTPSTWSTLMYVTGREPFSGKEIFVEREMGRKKKQQKMMTLPEVKKKSRR